MKPADCHTHLYDKSFDHDLDKVIERAKKLVSKKAGKDTLLMHPLPRVGEIETAVDSDPRAVYLTTEAKNGMYVRMALFSLILKS